MTGQDAAVDRAIAASRKFLGIDASEPVSTWSVERMQPGARDYVLVIFGAASHSSAIAAVDSVSAEVLEAARLHEAHTVISAAEAIRHAGFGPGADARLVWEPSTATRSRFYPMWELQADGRKVWVDSVRGVVWQTLGATQRGGSGGT